MSVQPDTGSAMLEYALGYWLEFRPVFPICTPAGPGRCIQHGACQNPGKVPLVQWQRYQTELPTADDLDQWWGKRWPQANIGMATGAFCGVVVLDLDSGEARKAALDRGIPPTPTCFTGKPGGVHVWFKHPGTELRNFARRLPGLDFRGDGGYVVLPPSLHVSRAHYRWAPGTQTLDLAAVPGWLLDLFAGPAETRQDEAGGYLDLTVVLDGIPEGQRDDYLFRYACKLRGDNVPQTYAELMVRQAARSCRPPFDEQAAADKVRAAYARYAPSIVLEVPPEGAAMPGHEAPDSSGVPGGYPIQSLAELMAKPVPETAALVDGLLFAQRTTWLFSDPNSGKTLIGLALGLHIAAGRPFCGLPVQQGAVLLIEEDSSLAVIQEYVEMLTEIYDFSLEDLPFYVNELQGLRVTDARGVAVARMAISAAQERSGGCLKLVLWDTAETLVPSEKFSSRELDPFAQCLRQTVNEGIANAVLDHTRKPPSQGPKGTPWKAPTSPSEILELLYGSRAKSAVSDVMIHLSGGFKAGGVRATFCKMRGELPAPLSLSFEPDTGFTISAQPRTARTPTEQKILKWLNNTSPGWHMLADIFTGAGVPERSGKRAVVAMRDRRVLEKDPDRSDHEGARYRLHPASEVAFQ